MTQQTVYVHIGLHKTGTTFLQNLLRANREAMRGQEIDFPGGPGEVTQTWAIWDLQGRRPRGVDDNRIGGSWDALVTAVNESQFSTVLISEERLSLSTPRQARKLVEAFPDADVQVIVTARDLGRVAVSAWQEEIKNDTTWTWTEFADAIKDPARLATNPARGFWLRQDLPKICEVWEGVVGADNVHVVTVPRSGTSPEVLLERFASVVGFKATKLTEQPAWNNETVGVAATEVLRRINQRLDGRLNQRAYDRVIKATVVQLLAKRTEPVRYTLPSEELPWITARAEQANAALKARGYQVVGDLEELIPQHREGGRRPDDATDDEVLEASLDALALLSERYATAWFTRRGSSTAEESSSGNLASKARGAIFRSQRRAASLADKSPTAAKMMGVVLKARDKTRLRARRKADKAPDPNSVEE